jgi:hypothetical protein
VLPPLFRLRRIEDGATREPPISGILHYPTGAGKPRTALEIIARGLKANPDHRFVWAPHSLNLLRQSMVRMAELARIFPPDTAFMWSRGANQLEDLDEADEYVDVTFMTRHTLTDVLERAVRDHSRRPRQGAVGNPTWRTLTGIASVPSSWPPPPR